MTMRLLIVGGSDAGISAALRAREVDQNAEITVLLADDFPNYSICGLPLKHMGSWAPQTTPMSPGAEASSKIVKWFWLL
jgi:NADPH-dependent 2,4-dienoyl-CoA reductase/sulfur reductase-like enzyme